MQLIIWAKLGYLKSSTDDLQDGIPCSFSTKLQRKELTDVTTLHLVTVDRQPIKWGFLIWIYGFCVPKEQRKIVIRILFHHG